jgi:Zn-dependent peptidase ImmA (M78 family)
MAIIRKRAQELVAQARALGWSGPPFDPRILASLRGIDIRPDRLSPDQDAFIMPSASEQLEIVFDPARPSTRQNFSISHEISHTLFPDGYEMIRYRQRHRDKFDPDHELEYLCDIGASEILLPAEDFSGDLADFGFTLRSVLPLRDRYEASREALIRRMVQFDGGRSAAVFLEYRLKPSEQMATRQLSFLTRSVAPRPKLRIAYAVPSEEFAIFLPPHKSIPDNSCVYRALESGEVESAEEKWGVTGLPLCRVEAMSMPLGDDLDASVRAVALLQL